ncbi:MAG: histidine kinase [Flavobacteriales bacterium]
MRSVRAFLVLSVLCAGLRSYGARPDTTLVDSVLSVPYDDLVRDLQASYHMLHRAIPEARSGEDRIAEGRIYHTLTIIHHLLGQSDSATHYGLKALELFRAEGDRLRMGEALCGLGHGLKRTDLPQAITYFRQGLAMLEAENAMEQLASNYDNFGVVHDINGDLDSAVHFFRKSLRIKEDLNDSIGIPYSLNKIASAMLPEGRFEEALQLMQRADTIRRAIDDRMGLADQPVYFGDLYEAWGRYPEAIAQFKQGVRNSEAMDFPYLGQYCHEHLALCYEAIGAYEQALISSKAARAIKDSITTESTTRTILQLKEQYNAAEKDREIASLAERSARRQLYIWIVSIAALLVVVFGLFLHQARQRRLRAERDASVIAEREAGLKAVFEATESERGRLARELHDGVGQQLGGLKHRLEAMRGKAPVQDVITIVDETSREVRDLAHQMMPKALSRLGLAPAMEEMVHRMFNETPVRATFEHFGTDRELPSEITTGLYRIAQELLNNILKHAGANEVDVQLMADRNGVRLLVQDNGRGLGNTIGDGIGLRNIKDRSRTMGGSFQLEGAPGSGTLATVRIPYPPTSK